MTSKTRSSLYLIDQQEGGNTGTAGLIVFNSAGHGLSPMTRSRVALWRRAAPFSAGSNRLNVSLCLQEIGPVHSPDRWAGMRFRSPAEPLVCRSLQDVTLQRGLLREFTGTVQDETRVD